MTDLAPCFRLLAQDSPSMDINPWFHLKMCSEPEDVKNYVHTILLF